MDPIKTNSDTEASRRQRKNKFLGQKTPKQAGGGGCFQIMIAYDIFTRWNMEKKFQHT